MTDQELILYCVYKKMPIKQCFFIYACKASEQGNVII